MTAELEPGARIEDLTVEAYVGAGTSSDVYRVRRDTGGVFALKLLRTHRPRKVARLEAEAAALQELRHPNVLQVAGTVSYEQRPGLVLELVNGPDLSVLIDGYEPSLLQVDDLAEQLFRGLEAVHSAGLVHRDLKPANVLLDLTHGDVVAKLADFELVRSTVTAPARRLTMPNRPLGTPRYMAPEQQHSAREADRRADVFSLGAILYELLSGVPAFGGSDVAETLARSASGNYRPLRQLRPQLPARMIDAVDGALRPGRDERIATVASLAEAWWTGATRNRPQRAWEAEHLACLEALVSSPGGGGTGTLTASASGSVSGEALVAPQQRATVVKPPSERPTVPASPPPMPSDVPAPPRVRTRGRSALLLVVVVVVGVVVAVSVVFLVSLLALAR